MAGWGAIFLAHIGKRLAGLETPFSIAPYLTVVKEFRAMAGVKGGATLIVKLQPLSMTMRKV